MNSISVASKTLDSSKEPSKDVNASTTSVKAFESWLLRKYSKAHAEKTAQRARSLIRKGLMFLSEDEVRLALSRVSSKTRGKYLQAWRLYHEFLEEVKAN